MARGAQLSNKTVLVWLGIFVIAALALRIGGNVGASFDDETGQYLYSGNDPYYHDRTVEHITETGESLLWDPAINFPDGGPNPNPPLFDWTTALDAKILESFGVDDPVGLALNLAVAFWGAIAVIPVYMIGAELFSRRAGLWAAFFMAVSAPHIQRSVFGFADHDATTMFFITLALAFGIKGLKALDEREYVPDWTRSTALLDGLKASFRHNKQAMLWSALVGTALSATALTWKGYPYVLAVLAVAVGLHLLNDHLKNKDSTAVWAFYLLPLIMVTIIPMIYYGAFPSFQDTTIWAGIYVLLGVVIVGAILVPTRDLPSILVFPALALTAAIGLLVMLLVVPTVGQTIFTGLGYFEQTKLYTTIAEAQRSELGRVAASFGFFTFLIAFAGLWKSLRFAWKGNGAHTLMLSWGIVALFMAFAASRFVMNAAPVFAIWAGAMMPFFTDWLKLGEVRKRFRQQHGQNQTGAAFKSLNTRAVGGGLLVFALFILPNVWIGVDASLPCEVDDCRDPDTKRLGAFGIDFDVKNNGWHEALTHLSTLDQDQALEDRPGFIAWWDYGHWATSIGKHPTVADPFQNHYNLAGRFLAAESEQAGMTWLSLLLINADYHRDDRSAYTPALEQVLRDIDPSLLEIGPMRGYDREFETFTSVVELETDEVFGVYDDISEATGKTVGYFGVDVRMYPFDAQNRPGIFYAPAFLANKNPDEFLQYQYRGSGLNLNVYQYGVDDNGDSYRLPQARTETASGTEYDVIPQGGGYVAIREGETLSQVNQGTPVQFSLQPTQRFFDSMYARGFGHSQNGFVPGDGLSHWRVILQSEGQSVELLEYYRGAIVSGVVRDDAGQPLEGVEVTMVDGLGASHDAVITGDDGAYSIVAPFAIDGDLTLVARTSDGTQLANRTDAALQFTRAQVENGHTVNGMAITVDRGSLDGRVYWDQDGDGAFTDGNDTLVPDASVSYAGQAVMTDGSGAFDFGAVAPGSGTVTVSADGFSNATRNVRIGAGEGVSQDIALTPMPSQVTFTLGDNSEDFPSIPFTLTGDGGFSRQLTTDDMGSVVTSLAPGTYDIDLNYQVTQDGQSVTYTANWTGAIPFGGEPRSFDVFVTKAVA